MLDPSLLPRVRFNIRANTSSDGVGSVVIQLGGAQTYKRTENGVPYALFKNLNGNYFGGSLPVGEYTLTVTPYSKVGGKGAAGTPLTIHFKIVYQATVSAFVLVNAASGEDIEEVKDGDLLNLTTLPTQKLSIRAKTSLAVGSVAFDLSGQQTHHQAESFAPYALYGGNKKMYNAWIPEAGSYTLIGVPYSAPNAGGTKGVTKTVHFSLVNGTAPAMTFSKPLQSSLSEVEVKTQLSATPNPFANDVCFQYTLATEARINIKIYDALGREISTVFNGQRQAGTHSVKYNAGKLVPGLYYCGMVTKVNGKDTVQILKLVKAE